MKAEVFGANHADGGSPQNVAMEELRDPEEAVNTADSIW
jgi:hypothetical protein